MRYQELNYALANEDSRVERELLPYDARAVIAIAGSGARVMPLFARRPRAVTCVDINPAQLFLTEMRIAALRGLDLSSYAGFLGYDPMPSSERRRIFLELPLSDEAREFLGAHLAKHDFGPIIYTGRWERTMSFLARLVKVTLGSDAYRVFHCQSEAEQAAVLENDFPWLRWQAAVLLFCRAPWFKALMYGGTFPKLTLHHSAMRYYSENFAKAFSRELAARNFFLQFVLNGELLTPEARPSEVCKDSFNQMQEGLRGAEVSYRLARFEAVASSSDSSFDFASMSDLASYVSEESAPELHRCINRVLRPGGMAVCRYYRYKPEVTSSPLANVTERYLDAIGREATGMYEFEILQRNT